MRTTFFRTHLSLLVLLTYACGGIEQAELPETEAAQLPLSVSAACPDGSEPHSGSCVPVQDDRTVALNPARELVSAGRGGVAAITCHPTSNPGHNFTCKCKTSGECLYLQIFCTQVIGDYYACDEDHSD